MSLLSSQEAFLDRALARARSGELKRPYRSGNVTATMTQAGRLRLTIVVGAKKLDVANAWIGACAGKTGGAVRRPSPDPQRLIIDVTLSTRG